MNTLNVAPVLDWMELVASKLTDRFKSKVRVYYETDQYVLKTAENAHEIEQVLKVRHKVFFEELQNKRKLFRIELDRLDFKCDHLLIIGKANDQVIGCYRLLSSHFIQKFYSEAEFQIGFLLQEKEPILELGRACILSEHRNGSVIQLLWRGITDYMKKTDSRFLMGCSSVQTMDPVVIASLIKKVEREKLAEEKYLITPTQKYHPYHHGVNLHVDEVACDFPPLIHAYLKAGAMLSTLPAIDKDFNCIDFFTLLDRKNLNPLFARRYFGE